MIFFGSAEVYGDYDGVMSEDVMDEVRSIEAVNLASETETRIIDLAKWVNELTGNEAGIAFKPRRDWDKVIRRRASIEKARKILGYEPKIDIKNGLRKTYEWFKKNLENIEACKRF